MSENQNIAGKKYIESGIYLIKKDEIIAIEKGGELDGFTLYLRGGHTLPVPAEKGKELWDEWLAPDTQSWESD